MMTTATSIQRVFLLVTLQSLCSAAEDLGQLDVAASYRFPYNTVGPYGWAYFTADIPSNAATVHFSFEQLWPPGSSNSTHPVVCFSIGGPSVPQYPYQGEHSLQSAALGALSQPFLTAEQGQTAWGNCANFNQSSVFELRASLSNTLPFVGGLWYIGVFSILDDSRFQSQMISRGMVYPFALSITAHACAAYPLPPLPSCSTPVTILPASPLPPSPLQALTPSEGWQELPSQCLSSPDQPALFSLTVGTPTVSLAVEAVSTSNSTLPGSAPATAVLAYLSVALLRLGTPTVYTDLGPTEYLVFPSEGHWQVLVRAQDREHMCFKLRWHMGLCHPGWGGRNCTQPLYELQRLLPSWQPESAFDYVFIPGAKTGRWPPGLWSSWFTLKSLPNKEPSASGSSPIPPSEYQGYTKGVSGVPSFESLNGSHEAPPPPLAPAGSLSWIYFSLLVPRGASGSILTLEVQPVAAFVAGVKRYGLVGGRQHMVDEDIYDVQAEGDILSGAITLSVTYPKQGGWYFGVYLDAKGASQVLQSQLKYRVVLHGCPGSCSWHGVCRSVLDSSHLYPVSYCYCDRMHGGTNCSLQLLTEESHVVDVFALVYSNAASLLPAIWAFQHSAYAEWIVYSANGAFSALYHSCDAGSYCSAPYGTLQFADFFLSFLSILVTFIYVASFKPAAKLAFSLASAIVAAIIARDHTTSGWSLMLVVGLGAAGLCLGWLLQFCPALCKRGRLPPRTARTNGTWTCLDCSGVRLLLTALVQRFQLTYLAGALGVLSVAAIGWFAETATTYWIWHSLFHISIFTSAYLFLASVVQSDDGQGLTAQVGHPVGREGQDEVHDRGNGGIDLETRCKPTLDEEHTELGMDEAPLLQVQ